MDIAERVRETADRYRMFRKGESVLAAVSGGPDSVALLDVLVRLAGDFELSLTVAHLNHMFRGAEADEDVLFVRSTAARYGLPCVTEAVDVPAYGREHGLSAQMAAREVRYRFLEETARTVRAGSVALGHNADDQCETILLNFLRGTGPAGLGGMPPVRGIYVRPLIDVRRTEIEAYCRRRNLVYREDSSNVELIYTRNRIRHQLIPLLEREYNPGLRKALLRLGGIARAEDGYLDGEAVRALARARQSAPGAAELVLSLERLRETDPVICRRVLQRAWREAAGNAATDHKHIEDLFGLVHSPVGGRLAELPGGLTAERTRHCLVIRKGSGPPAAAPYAVPLEVPGETAVPGRAWSVRAVLWDGEIDPGVACRGENRSRAYLDYDAPALPLELRNRRPGDVFGPFGLDGTVKLKKYFRDLGLPRAERDDQPLVVDARGRIIWVVGVRPADFCRITPRTRKVLFLQVLGRMSESGAEYDV